MPTLDPTPPVPAPPTDLDVTLYVVEILRELEKLAGRPRLRTLRYLLGMARLEAEQQLTGGSSVSR